MRNTIVLLLIIVVELFAQTVPGFKLVSTSDVMALSGTPSVGYVPTATSSSTATWQALGATGFAPAITTKTTTYAALATDYTILGDTSGGAFTITLPASPANGRMYIMKLIGASTALTVDGNGKNIEDVATYILSTQNESITIQYDGTEWRIL